MQISWSLISSKLKCHAPFFLELRSNLIEMGKLYICNMVICIVVLSSVDNSTGCLVSNQSWSKHLFLYPEWLLVRPVRYGRKIPKVTNMANPGGTSGKMGMWICDQDRVLFLTSVPNSNLSTPHGKVKYILLCQWQFWSVKTLGRVWPVICLCGDKE